MELENNNNKLPIIETIKPDKINNENPEKEAQNEANKSND